MRPLSVAAEPNVSQGRRTWASSWDAKTSRRRLSCPDSPINLQLTGLVRSSPGEVIRARPTPNPGIWRDRRAGGVAVYGAGQSVPAGSGCRNGRSPRPPAGSEFAGLCLLDANTGRLCDASLLPQAGGLLSQVPEGLAILDVRLKILWTNRRFQELAGSSKPPIGIGFYDAFGAPEILGPDLSPFHTALGTGAAAHSTLRLGEKTYFQVHATPVSVPEAAVPCYLVVSVRDVSAEILQQQKFSAIYQAGLELGDLSPAELLEMSVQDRGSSS